MRAPIWRSGVAARSIGRFISDESPISSLSKRWPASSPVIRRIAVPELPMSSACAGCLAGRCSPTPCTRTSLRAGLLDAHAERAHRRHGREAVLAFEKAATSVTPSAMPPSMSARCEIDLSPGTRTAPATPVTGWTT